MSGTGPAQARQSFGLANFACRVLMSKQLCSKAMSLDTPRMLELTEHMPLSCAAGAAVAITASEWDDVVVWTPWTDMDCYRSFCCVENAKFKPVTVAPGDSWRAQTTLEIKDL